MVCSSFVAINRGTNQRYPYAPLGAEEYPSVARGNLLASRYLVKNESVYACMGILLNVLLLIYRDINKSTPRGS